MTDTEMMMLAVLAVLAVVVITQRAKQKPQAIEQPPANVMNPEAWEIGPIMWGDNESQGLPLHPLPHPDGWAIDIPYPTREAGHAHYITVPTGPLSLEQTITLRLRIEADPSTRLVPVKFPEAKGLITLYFQRGGDKWTGDYKYRWYRWYASFGTVTDPRTGELVMTARLDDPRWGAVMGGTAATNPAEFAAALANASRVGFARAMVSACRYMPSSRRSQSCGM